MAIAKATGYRLGGTGSGSQITVAISDYRWMITQLREIDKDLAKEFRQDWKRISSRVAEKVKQEIPSRPPLSGMAKKAIPGRVTWGTGKPARSVTTVVGDPRPKKGVYRIAQVVVKSPATVMADFAGINNSKSISGQMTQPYDYARTIKGKYGTVRSFRTIRKHRVTTQGKVMADKLNQRLGKTSRMVYDGAEAAIPDVQRELIESMNSAVAQINRNLRKANP
jgi:hypothetical protein